jgi:hypothetical protein
VSSAIGTSKNDPVHAGGTPLGVLVQFDRGGTHRYMRAAWHKLSVLPPGMLEGEGAASLSEEESTHIKQARATNPNALSLARALTLSLSLTRALTLSL